MSVQPMDKPKEVIDPYTWAGVIGNVNSRTSLLGALDPSSATHSFYKPLWPLLRDLAHILRTDRHCWTTPKPEMTQNT